ncbi:MAG: hypothetical protein HOV82_16760 [Streptomyces sp.]|nr:hypothetical protein [Streptomyces sp.]NUP36174.1 hypothetical protein [Streptomyces sp.]NUS75521.1 hypothetical protein [Streptomyces sp.]
MTAHLISSHTLWNLHCAQGRRDALLNWVRANGIDPNAVPTDKDLTIEDRPDGGRIIRYTTYVLTGDGHKQVAQASDGGALLEERSVPLVVEPPADWPVYAVPGKPGEQP